jgi:hypothetical protein
MHGRRWMLMVGLVLVAGVCLTAQRGQGRGQSYPPGQCPPGTTEVRPGRCEVPDLPAPSILDYRPRSTLVTGEQLVPPARDWRSRP